jgi:hypothetical protein
MNPVQAKCCQSLAFGSVFALVEGGACEMTARIEKDVDGQTTTIRLIGQVQAEHLDALKEQIESSGPRPLLDLDEVTLVDVQVVRFLGACEEEGTELLHCPPYVREWISREKGQ